MCIFQRDVIAVDGNRNSNTDAVFISNDFFNSFSLLLNVLMDLSLKCWLSNAYYTKILCYRDLLYLVFVFTSLSRSIYVFYMWSIFPFSFSFSVTYSQWSRQTSFFGQFYLKFSLRDWDFWWSSIVSYYPIYH